MHPPVSSPLAFAGKRWEGKRKVRWMLLFCLRFISNCVLPCSLQPWESQSFCSSFPYDIVCGDSWGQSLLVATDSAGVMLLEGETAFSWETMQLDRGAVFLQMTCKDRLNVTDFCGTKRNFDAAFFHTIKRNNEKGLSNLQNAQKY